MADIAKVGNRGSSGRHGVYGGLMMNEEDGELSLKLNLRYAIIAFDFKRTIEANVCEETLDVVGFVVGLINNTTFVNVAIFNGFIEFGNGRGDAGDFGYFWDELE
ncbi:hypothetical protein Tco_0682111 [Tanacetum coccineum]|uniref:Uncharacterized protein n=1 Tax=Tanacetum coccineum TaxID=301880 RepID=A0ABQ4XQ94_9ASTR